MEIPSWAAAALAALLGFAGAWAALRVTVRDLKDDVADLKQLMLTVTTLQAQHSAMAAELERARAERVDTRNAVHRLAERIAGLEAKEIVT